MATQSQETRAREIPEACTVKPCGEERNWERRSLPEAALNHSNPARSNSKHADWEKEGASGREKGLNGGV